MRRLALYFASVCLVLSLVVHLASFLGAKVDAGRCYLDLIGGGP